MRTPVLNLQRMGGLFSGYLVTVAVIVLNVAAEHRKGREVGFHHGRSLGYT